MPLIFFRDNVNLKGLKVHRVLTPNMGYSTSKVPLVQFQEFNSHLDTLMNIWNIFTLCLDLYYS